MLTVKTDFGNYNVWFEIRTYSNNNSLALLLMSEEGPFAKLTTNIGDSDYIKDDTMAYVDTNNCPWAEDFILDNKLGEPTGFSGHSGFCSYPLYRFDMSVIRQHLS